MSNYFKCGRCGDVFKTRPVVDKPLELRDEDEDKKEATNHKKIKLSHDAIGSDLNGAASTSGTYIHYVIMWGGQVQCLQGFSQETGYKQGMLLSKIACTDLQMPSR